MKIAFVSAHCGSGAISRILFSILQLLEQRGDEGCYFYSRGCAPAGKQAVSQSFGTRLETNAHVLLTRLTDAHGLGSAAATRQLLAQLRAYDPDIIHLNNIHGYTLNYPLLFQSLREWGKPVVWTFHDCWPFTGHCVHFEDISCDRWKTGCHHCPQKKEYPASLLLDRSRKNYLQKEAAFTQLEKMTIVTPSQWLKALVERSFLGSQRCLVIHNGIDLTCFRPSPSDLRERYRIGSKRLILAVANVWTAKKGYQDLLTIARLLPEDCQLVMVGLSEKQARQLAGTAILPITHTSSVQELAQWYSAADVFCNPTYEDTFPTVNIESLACGTPVVTYQTGGSPEILTQDCGAVVPLGDTQAMAQALTRLQKQEALCRSRAENFNCKEKFLEYIHLYETLLS